jgi:hypothetical protein
MGPFEHCSEPLGFIKCGEFLENTEFVELWLLAAQSVRVKYHFLDS